MKRIHEKIQYNWFLLGCTVCLGFVCIVFFYNAFRSKITQLNQENVLNCIFKTK